MRKTKDDASKTKAALLDAAQAVFLAKGYGSTSLEDIASKGGVTRGAIYHHFKNGKPQILNELCLDRYGKLGSTFEKLSSSKAQPSEKLRQMMLFYFEQLFEDRDFSELQYILIYKTELTDEIMGGMRAKVEGTRALVEQYAALVKEAVVTSEKRPVLPPAETAKILVCFQSGLTNLWLADRDSVALQTDAPKMVDALLQQLLT